MKKIDYFLSYYNQATKCEEVTSGISLLQVGRRADPTEDAAVIKEVRKKVGSQIELRADANQKWAYEDAIQFGSSVKDCGLQYIEVCLWLLPGSPSLVPTANEYTVLGIGTGDVLSIFLLGSL